MWYSLYILIILTSTVFLYGKFPEQETAYWVTKECAFQIFGFITIAVSLFSDNVKRITFRNKWFGALLIFTILSFGYYFYRPLILGRQWHLWNYRSTINVILGIFLTITLVENTSSLKQWINVSKVLCWCAFLISIFALLQWLGLDQLFKRSYTWQLANDEPLRKYFMVTFFGQKFLTCNYIAIISPMCLVFKELRYKVMYGTILLTLILADSSVSLLAFLVGLLVYLMLMKKWKVLIIVLIAGCLLMGKLSLSEKNFFHDGGRIMLWKQTVEKIVKSDKREYLGYGFGNFAGTFKVGEIFKEKNQKYTQIALSAHNEFMQMFFEGGIIGLIIVFGYLITLFRRVFYVYIANNNVVLIGYICGFISFLIICLAGFPFRIAPLALLGILYISHLEVQTGG